MKPSQREPIEQYYAPDHATWRAWLTEHHATKPGVWLVYYKQHTGKLRVAYGDAVEEALCFGWIDSRPNALDAQRSMQLFSPRKPTSPWSRLNKSRVARLIDAGAMTSAGLAVIAAAKQNGAWNRYDAIEALEVPADLQVALDGHVDAARGFAAFSPTTKKQLLWWITSAKRAETRTERIARLLHAAAEGHNPIAFVRKPKSL